MLIRITILTKKYRLLNNKIKREHIKKIFGNCRSAPARTRIEMLRCFSNLYAINFRVFRVFISFPILY